jgi:hypothetical protein
VDWGLELESRDLLDKLELMAEPYKAFELPPSVAHGAQVGAYGAMLFVDRPHEGALERLPELPELRQLILRQSVGLHGIQRFTGLQVLRIIDCTSAGEFAEGKVESLAPLTGLDQLRILVIDNAEKVTDLTPLAELQSLRQLALHRCPALVDLEPLRGHPSLRELSLQGCRGLRTLEDIAQLPLETLDLAGCEALEPVPRSWQMQSAEEIRVFLHRCLDHRDAHSS